jgi:cation-transporting ATPase 13A1
MYKILALNCLLTAYSLSVLALKGVKFSDYQSTYMGFAVSIFFLMLSRAVPLKNLNENKPPNTIFTISAIISIVGQAIVDLIAMLLIIKYTEIMDPISIAEVKSLDEDFSPTLMNTIMFIYQMINQTITFVVNYQGEPFMENMSKNSGLKKFLYIIIGLTLVIIFDLYPQLNETLELLPLPDDITYKCTLIGIMVVNYLLCYLLENWKYVFGFYIK